jgi:hypothetical protein
MPVWQPDLDARSYPILLPQVTCLGQDLYLGSRKLDRLTPGQAGFLAGCSGYETFADILREHELRPADILHLSRYLLWWPTPVGWKAPQFEACDRLVLCTQPQPAILAMGGRILDEAAGTKTRLLSCFNPPAETADLRIYRDVEEYRLGCLDESFLLARVAGIAIIDWNLSLNSSKDDDHFEHLVHDLISKEEPAEIFIPAALGRTRTALLIRNTVLKLFAEGYIQGEVQLYADEPSGLGHRLIDEFESWFEDSYLNPVAYVPAISNTGRLCRKIIPDLFRCGTAVARSRKWAGHVERFWKLGFTDFI